MIVDFLSIDIKGFMSIGEATINLENQGTVYVTGSNNSPGSASSNGSGKSTIFEAIIYALTGTTLRGTTDVINKYWSGGYCEVTLHVSVDNVVYDIKRTRNHPEYGNNLKLMKDGADISGDKLRKSESILANELGQLSSSLISSVIILGQGLPNKFTDLKPAARKDRLEELSQSSEFINELKVRLTNFVALYNKKYNDTQVLAGKEETKVQMIESSLKSKSEQLVQLAGVSDDQFAQLEDYVSDITVEINQLEGTLPQLQQVQQALTVKRDSYNSDVMKLSAEISSRNSEIRRLSSELSLLHESKCPTCGQYITSPDTVQEMTSNINVRSTQLNTEIQVLQSKISMYQELIEPLNKAITDKLAEYQNTLKSISDKKSGRTKAELELEQMRNASKILNDEITKLRTSLTEASSALSKLQDESLGYSSKLNILDYLTKKSSKEFRGYLLKGVINYLNSKLVKYSTDLFGTASLELVLEDNKIFIEYDGRPYENLSGGERQRADLAMQFSLRDMLMNSIGFKCNLLVVDEGFDNLDDAGVASLVSVINNSNIQSVFTISHHSLSIPFDKTLVVNKGLDKVSTVTEVI